MDRPTALLLAVGTMLVCGTPARAQSPDRSPASILRAVPDPRLALTTESSLSLDRTDPLTTFAAPEDSAYANYGLEGALIGGLTTGLAFTFLLCTSLEDADCGPFEYVLGTAVLGLPGFVVGGLLGAAIKKGGRAPPASGMPPARAVDPGPTPLREHWRSGARWPAHDRTS